MWQKSGIFRRFLLVLPIPEFHFTNTLRIPNSPIFPFHLISNSFHLNVLMPFMVTSIIIVIIIIIIIIITITIIIILMPSASQLQKSS